MKRDFGTPQTWYQVASYSVQIIPVKVTKATEHTVTVLESFRPGEEHAHVRRNDQEYFPTFAEARTALVDRTFFKVQEADAVLNRRREDWVAAMALTEKSLGGNA